MSKRHAPPTVLQLVQRIYRKQMAMQHDMENQLCLVRLDLQALRHQSKTMTTLTEHCHRLLREKETLQRQLALQEANRFMAEPVRHHPV